MSIFKNQARRILAGAQFTNEQQSKGFDPQTSFMSVREYKPTKTGYGDQAEIASTYNSLKTTLIKATTEA